MQETANTKEFSDEPHFPAPCQWGADAVVRRVYYYCALRAPVPAGGLPASGAAPTTLEESTGGEGGGAQS